MRRRVFLSAVSLFGAGSSLLAAQAEKSPIPDPEPKKLEKLPDNVDADRYNRAPVVLRAKLMQPLGGETGVMWYRMKVVETLKNTVRQKFGPTEDLYTTQALGKGIPRDPGPPAEECTIYIEPVVQRIDGKDVTHWRFLDGNSTSGVSHVAK
jgi:hypothetical protein